MTSPAQLIAAIDQRVSLDPEIKEELLALLSAPERTPQEEQRLKDVLDLLELEALTEYGMILVEQEMHRQAEERLNELESQLEQDAQGIERVMDAFIAEERRAEEESAVDEARRSIEQLSQE